MRKTVTINYDHLIDLIPSYLGNSTTLRCFKSLDERQEARPARFCNRNDFGAFRDNLRKSASSLNHYEVPKSPRFNAAHCLELLKV